MARVVSRFNSTSDARRGFDQLGSVPEEPARVAGHWNYVQPFVPKEPTGEEKIESEVKVQFYTGAGMLPIFMHELTVMHESICAFQYVTDHTECYLKIALKLGQGVRGRFILDKAQFENSSCARQAARVAELVEAGQDVCEVRVLKPQGGGFACMHAKTVIIDNRVVLTGSVNMTHNGIENNKEHMFRILEPTVVKALRVDFEETWRIAQPVTQEMCISMVRRAEQARIKRQERSASSSRSLSREHN
jgi:phosphatidylserine/phosphatidylglycerophosphate/cardiolipin synthase-like enzyme